MAPIPATITVNFISNYAGGHRVCWRIGNSGPYDCTTIVICAGGGSPCSANVPITVDNDTCASVDFEGYVQAICEVEGSLNGRVPFSASFIPDPTCDKYDITCSAVSVEDFTITNQGSGYTVGSTPVVTIAGGGGSSATAYAEVGDGGIKTFTITNGGAGYLAGGTGTINLVPTQNITGSGVGATFTVTVTVGVITGVTLTSIATAGSGYAVNDTFEFNNALFGGSGAGAIITVDSLNTGEIYNVVLTAPGSGYSSQPTGTVAPPPAGVTALVVVNLATCSDINLGNDCDGNAIGILPGLPLGEAYHKCTSAAYVAPAGYVAVVNGCCYDCVYGTFTNASLSETIDVAFTDCTTGAFTQVSVAPSTSYSACMVNGSETYPADPDLTFLSAPTCP